MTFAYLFCYLPGLVINFPLLPEKRISQWVSIRCKRKLNPVSDNLMIVEELGLIDFYVSFQSFSSLGTKTIAPVIQPITNLYVYTGISMVQDSWWMYDSRTDPMDRLGHPELCTFQNHRSCPRAPGLAPLKGPPREKEHLRDSLREGLAG